MSGNPPLHILQPIRSGDPRLADTLGAMLVHTGRAQLHWLVDESDAEAIRVTARLRETAHVPESVTISLHADAPAGVNPKTHKLAEAHAALPDESITLVVDDDTIVSEAGVDALLAALEAGAAIATGLPKYDRRGTSWSRLVADWVNTNAPITYLGLGLEPLSINGMTYAIRTDVLRGLGGFGATGSKLADDLAMAELVRDGGGRIAQTSVPQLVGTHVESASEYVRLQHRWSVFANIALGRQPARRRARVLTELGVPPVALGLSLAGGLAIALAPRASARARALALTATLSGLAARRVIARRVEKDTYGSPVTHTTGATLTEALTPLHAAAAFAWPRITWRGRRIHVLADNTFVG